MENNSTIEQSRNTPKGDAQSVPKGWVETALGEASLINPRENIAKGTLAPNIPMAFLEAFSKKIQNFEWKKFKGGTKFKNGDTLLARITPCLENGKTAFVDILDKNEISLGLISEASPKAVSTHPFGTLWASPFGIFRLCSIVLLFSILIKHPI
jgi:hypothetical protein